MASKRNLKKDIDYLLSLVLEECMVIMESLPADRKEKALEIGREVIVKHRELRIRVNHIDGKDNPALVKSHFQKVAQDLYLHADRLLGELGAL